MQRSYHFEHRGFSFDELKAAMLENVGSSGHAEATLRFAVDHRKLVRGEISKDGQGEFSDWDVEAAGTTLALLLEKKIVNEAKRCAPCERFRLSLELIGRFTQTEKEDVRWVTTLTAYPAEDNLPNTRTTGVIVLRVTVDYKDRKCQEAEDLTILAAHIQAVHGIVLESLKLKPLESVHLALSGGGLRATFFHAGVFLAMRDMGLLPLLHSISTVSGGSVFAAHMAVNWGDYSSVDRTKVIGRLDELCVAADSDLRGRAILASISCLCVLSFAWLVLIWHLGWGAEHWAVGAWLLLTFISPSLGFTFFASRALRKTFSTIMGKKAMFEIREDSRPGTGQCGLPDIYFTATDLSSHSLCAHTMTGFLKCITTETGTHRKRAFDQAGQREDIGNVVYASAAYPFLLPFRRKSDFRDPVAVLADGGLFDNSGLGLLISNKLFNDSENLQIPNQEIRCIIASDAAAAWRPFNKWRHYWLLHKRVPKSIDVMMEIKSHVTLQLAQKEFTNQVRMPSIDDPTWPPGGLDDSDVRRWCLGTEIIEELKSLRTDFNRFDRVVTTALIRWGYLQGVSHLCTLLEKREGSDDGDWFNRAKSSLLSKPVEIANDLKFKDELLFQRLKKLNRTGFLGNLLPSARAWCSREGIFLTLVSSVLVVCGSVIAITFVAWLAKEMLVFLEHAKDFWHQHHFTSPPL